MTRLIIGPFFTVTPSPWPLRSDELSCLGVQIEWANEHAGVAIPLFRRRLKYAPHRLRFEDVMFSALEVSFDLTCSEYQIIKTSFGVYLPLDTLLAGLHANCEVPRSVFSVLAELTSFVPLQNSTRQPKESSGLLVPNAELNGFRLQSVIRNGDRLYAEIGWQPLGHEFIFHTRICQFQFAPDGQIRSGYWMPPGVIGVAQILSRELRRLAPGPPEVLFSSLGWERLQKTRSQQHQLVAAE